MAGKVPGDRHAQLAAVCIFTALVTISQLGTWYAERNEQQESNNTQLVQCLFQDFAQEGANI